MYIQLVLCQLFVDRKATKRETQVIGIPVWTQSHLGKVGCSAPHSTPCSAAHAHPVRLSLHLPACGGTHCTHLTESGHRSIPTPPGIVTRTVFPNIPALPHAQGRLLLLTPLLGGRGAAALMKIFNDGYQLVLQASESHLNSGNFKLFWQYKRA